MKDRRLLHRIFSGGKKSELAWKEFLALYSNLFLNIIAKFTTVHDEAMEKYLFICSKLCKDNFSLLKKYNSAHNFRKPKLSTWLTVVVRNLCIDEFRTNHGRRRLPSAIKSLSDFDIYVFKLYYWFNYKEKEICHILGKQGNANDKVMDSIAKISSLLKNTKIGNYKNFTPVFIELDETKFIIKKYDSIHNNISEQINNAADKLNPLQKVVIKLRFWEGLSPQEIADLLKFPRRKIYDILQTTIKKLKIEFSNITET